VSIANAGAARTPRATLYPIVGDSYLDVQSVAVTGESATFQVAAGLADAYQVMASTIGDTPAQQQQHTVRGAATSPLSADVAEDLAWLEDVAIDGDGDAPDFRWKGDTRATTGGGLYLQFQPKNRDAPSFWTILVPPGTTTVHRPKLPDDASDFLPKSGLDAYELVELAFFSVAGATPAELRANIGAAGVAAVGPTAAMTRYLGGDGSFRTTLYQPR
jgi:hypothetical protein